MILVDTSVWIDHLRSGDARLVQRLNQGDVLGHPLVTGELALGSMRQRTTVLEALQALPQATQARDDEVLHFVARHALHGLGIGWVDAHLLASARLTAGAQVWTRDRRLLAACQRLGLAHEVAH
ncbi:type II toxin-antitoxin system VapC family toxin [Hydrogenophaga sp. 2FB]|uniref:type II toxin-antitoxin system VapC family toxin n=1 Tax=Hydrogenophaga sp. 2FB TaxID=2502187 RepID=UPI0010F57040|nr:type II toxin-antitoxin system VapC family toxin [Hydrogenophaga sp. 2FB]